jgi:hypothetical protein
MQLNAQKQSLAGLLGGLDYQLVIPPYQRPYAWGREQVDDLWDDVLSAIGHGHFMGSLVLNSADEQRPQVIDGQQRLTTLLLLISLLQDKYRALGVPAKAEPLYTLLHSNQFAEGDARYRLRTGDANWSVFRDYVLRRYDDADRRTWDMAHLETRIVRSRNQALFDNAKLLAEKLDTWLEGLADAEAVQQIEKLQQTLIQKLDFVVVSVGSAPDAFLLFETLNDRGLQLSQGDLLKNHLLSKIAADTSDPTAEVEAAADEWDGLLDDLGSTVDVTRFLRHYLLARSFPVKKEQVFDKFKAQVNAKGPLPLLKELRDLAVLYGQIAEPAKVESDPEMQALLQALNVLRAETCHPALLVASKYLSRDDFVAFARLAEILTYRYSSVCGLNGGDLQAAYHRAAKLLLDSKGADLDAARAEITQMMPGSEQFIPSFQRQRMGAQYLARYTLQGIERALNPGKEFKGNDAVHIEHIMPQTPNEDWKECLGETVADHPVFVQRWGNLALLHAPLNQEASNYSFADKQAKYDQSEVVLTQDLTAYLRWGYDVIEQRQKWMAELADAMWSVDGHTAPEHPSPAPLDAALDSFEPSQRAALASYLPAAAPATKTDLITAIDGHATSLELHGVDGAAEIAGSLRAVISRWGELGTDGRRLVAAAVAYFADVGDQANDLGEGGLDDDLAVLHAACDALALDDIAPE